MDNINRPEYRNNGFAYEMEERARPDEMGMLNKLGETANRVLDEMKSANVLDICCGTGLSIENLLFHKNISKIVGVDNCENYLNFAKIRFNKVQNLQFIFSDVIDVDLPTNHWDVILMASAYHHLEDNRKLVLLQKVYNWLKPNGIIVMAENILPEYENTNIGYQESVKYFYKEVLKTAKEQNPLLPEDIASLIWRVAQHGCEGDYEYKTSLPVLKTYLDEALLKIISQERVWPQKESGLFKSTGGNYVFKIKK